MQNKENEGDSTDAHKELKTAIMRHEKGKREQNAKVAYGIHQPIAKYSISFVYSLDASMVILVCFIYKCCGAKVRGFFWRRKLLFIMVLVAGHVTAVTLYSRSGNGVAATDQAIHKTASLERVPKKEKGSDITVNDNMLKHEPTKVATPTRKSSEAEMTDLPLKAVAHRKCNSFHFGPYNMVDDTGYVCPLRSADFSSGCCPRYTSSLLLKKQASSKRYVCKDCHEKMQCCKNFENCVSCCMGKLAKEKHNDAKKNNVNDISKPRELIYDGIKIFKPPDCFDKNIFAKCQCRCKTHSQLSRHENSYRTPWHFCYHETPPPRQPYELIVSNVEESCVSACDRHHGMVCEDHDLVAINNCDNLNKKFTCGSCEGSRGSDQPAFKVNEKSCLYNTNLQYISCSGQHKSTKRLCPCRKPWR